jgi:hypothetical protein
MRCLLAITFLLAYAAAASAQQGLRPIHDARSSPRATRVSKADQVLLKKEALPAARRVWRDNAAACEGEFRITEAATGSFTRPAASQRAILYQYCETGHNFALNGIAVTEGGRVVHHVVYEGAWDNSIAALPDINGNGLSELLISTGGTSQGITWGGVSIIELSANEVKEFGQTGTYEDNCGMVERGGKSTAYRLLVRPGATPLFYKEAFVSRGCNNSNKWTKLGTVKRVSMEEDGITYRIVK